MLRLILLCAVLAGCDVAVAGAGTDGNVSWSFTINNTLPASAAGGGGLLVVVTYADGSSATYLVSAGSSLSLPARGSSVRVEGGGTTTTAGPGGVLTYSGSGWSLGPAIPAAAG